MKSIFSVILILLLALSADARNCGRVGCMAPRPYRYSRSPRDSLDLVSQVLSTPLYFSNTLSPAHRTGYESVAPRYEVLHGDEAVELVMELPGVSQQDLDVQLVDNRTLQVRGARRLRRQREGAAISFDLSFELDAEVDPGKLEAFLVDGVLTVRAPKKNNQVKRIQVEVRRDAEQPVVLENAEHESVTEKDVDELSITQKDE